ncbi:hypothetical protein U0038_17375 [Sphingobacterium spiritivorum]|uniref:Uncharacterized protein n=1 Tax=Sphingobacterium spiritivorum ATCC 33861 TaxID=525373 RepID=D7VN90_SPHSI|nr:hypothetical protein [Sphingobacterium spiritivorum]EFK57387.1 hypothetical protein HMPREF0766_12460 [Sphingobacterium spiritivorum ATCC 33861]QQT36538.1 hypothetical protein I6J01_03665 [Sphingobacterium spiritivorum]WQD33289.1 hypothetical protein U0038_17375 [Sphingobacterium spiritivorum]SUJ21577.1 Uncharacterised protein [Sphingobacterium spiritivorum]
MKYSETFKDPLAKALKILQQKIPEGQSASLSELVTKKGGENSLKIAVMKLIDAGWTEYEFTEDFKYVKRLKLPDYAKDYLQKIWPKEAFGSASY